MSLTLITRLALAAAYFMFVYQFSRPLWGRFRWVTVATCLVAAFVTSVFAVTGSLILFGIPIPGLMGVVVIWTVSITIQRHINQLEAIAEVTRP